MKILHIFYIIALFFITTTFESPIGTTQLSSNKYNSKNCSLFDKSTLQPGEYKTISRYCIKAMCDEFSVLYYHGCATYMKTLPPNCKFIYLKMDSLNQYPDCCPYLDCYGNASFKDLQR